MRRLEWRCHGQESEDTFLARFGFRGSALGVERFLPYGRLTTLGADLALQRTLVEPWYGSDGYVARLRRRVPARFKLIVGSRRDEAF